MMKLFPDIWGQDRALEVLGRNLERDKIASAYLFSGPGGTGKMTAAIAFARALLCRSDNGERSFPECACGSCRMFKLGSHPDFMGIIPTESKSKNENFNELVRDPGLLGKARKGRSIKIEQVRELTGAFSLKSYFGGRKVAVVESPETMDKGPANAFLKTLEEPPEGAVIILVSSNTSALLPTIVSRCRVIRFVPMRQEELAEKLERERSMPREEARRLALLSDGCPGEALGGEIGQTERVEEEAEEIMARILEMEPDEVARIAEAWKNRREDIPLFFQRITEILRFAGSPNFYASSGRMSEALQALGSIPAARLVDGYFSILDRGPLLAFNPNVQMLIESTIYDMQSIFLKGEPIAG
jgi:DNA polymerase-3 subunit delta'